MADKKPIEEIDHFKTYSKTRYEYQNLSRATRFFSYFAPNSETRAGRLRSSMAVLDNYLRVEGVEKEEKEDAFKKYVKQEEERRVKDRKFEFEKTMSDDIYDKVHAFTESSDFRYQEAQDRYDTIKECYDEIPWTQKLYSRLLPDSWTHCGRIRKSLNMSKRMLDRQLNGDALFKPVPGKNLSKNETLMYNYIEKYKSYAKEYSKLSGFQKFIGRILPSSMTDYGKLKTDMEVNDMMLLRETNLLTSDDLEQIRDKEYDKIVNPDKYKTTPEEEEKEKQYIQDELNKDKHYKETHELNGEKKDKEKDNEKENLEKKDDLKVNEENKNKENEKDKINENQVVGNKEKDNLEKSNVDLKEIKKDPNNKEVTNNNNNLLNQEQLKENKDLDKSQNELNNNEILKDDKKDPIEKDDINKSNLDLNKENKGPQIKNIKNEDESLNYGKLDIDLSDNHLDPLDLDEMNGKFYEHDKQINNDDKKPEEIGENNNEQQKNGVNIEKTLDLQNMLGRDTGANIPNSSNENYQKNLEEMNLNNVIQNEHYSDMKN